MLISLPFEMVQSKMLQQGSNYKHCQVSGSGCKRSRRGNFGGQSGHCGGQGHDGGDSGSGRGGSNNNNDKLMPHGVNMSDPNHMFRRYEMNKLIVNERCYIFDSWSRINNNSRAKSVQPI